MEFIEKIKDRMFYMYLYENQSITLTDCEYGKKNPDFYGKSIFSIVRIGEIYFDFIQILYVDEINGNIIESIYFPKNSIKSITIDYV